MADISTNSMIEVKTDKVREEKGIDEKAIYCNIAECTSHANGFVRIDTHVEIPMCTKHIKSHSHTCKACGQAGARPWMFMEVTACNVRRLYGKFHCREYVHQYGHCNAVTCVDCASNCDTVIATLMSVCHSPLGTVN